MPQRFLRPGITNSDQWNAVSFPAQSLYVRILTLVDDFGRYDARVPILHGQCFALRPEMKPQQTAALRSELHARGLITVYVVEGKEYLQIEKWQERARCDASKYPVKPKPAADGSGPQESASSLAITSSPLHPIPSPSPLHPRQPRKRAVRVPLTCAAFQEFWTAYPRKEAIADAEKAWVENECASKLPEILSAIRARKPAWQSGEVRFIPHPATWLNRRGWQDEVASPHSKNGLTEDFSHLVEEAERE